jgi:DUF4097 and DUF4098 domain-containing protein YvlB
MRNRCRWLAGLSVGCLVAIGATVYVSGSGAYGGWANDRGFESTDCSRYRSEWDDDEVAYGEEQISVSKGEAAQITARGTNGGMLVTGWDRDDYGIKVCKMAAGTTRAEAEARLAAMNLRVSQGTISVASPSGNKRWVVHYIISAPRDGAVDLTTVNGPVGFRSFSGTAKAQTTNGPISIKQSSGEIDARAVNGPVSVEESSGRIVAMTQNGPIRVRLTGQQWEGQDLEARTHNGPVSLSVPDEFGSGVEVAMGRSSPFRCSSPLCTSRTDTGEGDKRIVLGGGSPTVRVSTQRGPVTISSAGEGDK